MTALPGFDPAPVEKLSYGRRLTARKNAALAAGIHPASGRPLAGNAQTCGSCAHCRCSEDQRVRFYKCDLVPRTFGPLTDIRVGWPACTAWERQEAKS
jgi:hypothetical protein